MILMILMGVQCFRLQSSWCSCSVLCHVLNASWFVVFWCPEAEDQVWTAAKTGTSSLTNMCKICANRKCIWYTFYALCIMLSNVQHVFLSFLSHFVAGFRYSHWHFMYSRAGYNFSSSVIIWSQAKSEQTILYVKAPACPVCLGEEMNSVRERACIIGPSQCEMMWKMFFGSLGHDKNKYKIMR